MPEPKGRSDGSTYSLSYQWPRQRVIVHVHKELDPRSARDLADSLLWFAERCRLDAAKGHSVMSEESK
jgi:hypothetical protein